ncbi:MULTISPECIES: PfkB family carbohydrate kinase [unclassified Agarivorans]|uniref:PfkB family carbohydrate kinase n=1 Tax=unclassified Agarivorans TaxID=2636026 RepID=UPI003D7CE29B
MTNREQQILTILRDNPMIAQQELASQLGISRSAVAGHIMNLTNKGLIKGKGYIIASQRSAVVIGGANMDLCGKASGTLIAGDSNLGTLHNSPGGVARNIADNLARLGSKVDLVSNIGKDQWGEQLIAACQEAGIGVSHLLRSQTSHTATYLSIHDASGEMQLALNDMRILEELDSSQLVKHKSLLSYADLLILDANLSEDALAYLFDCIETPSIFVDPVSTNKAHKLRPYLGQIELLKPNLIEAELLSGVTINSDDDLPRVCEALHQAGVNKLLLSLGARGIYASDQQQVIRLSNVNPQVINVTGAGDAMMAGMSHASLQNWSWQDSVEFAFACAQIATQSEHTINPLISERAVRRHMESHHA